MPTLNWIGKDAVVNHHNDVPFRTLDKKYTFGDVETCHGASLQNGENKIIHGDNLEALKSLLPEYEGKITVGKLNVDDNDETCSAYGIMNIPTILFFKNGELVNRSVGAMRKPDLQKLFEELL